MLKHKRTIPQRLRDAMEPACDSFLGVKLPVSLVTVSLLSKGPCSWLAGSPASYLFLGLAELLQQLRLGQHYSFQFV